MSRKILFVWMLAAVVLSDGCARVPRQSVMPMGGMTAVPAPTGFYVTLERGQTLYRIAKTYQVDLGELMRVNHIQNPSHLEVGQQIFVPQRHRFWVPGFTKRAGPVDLEGARKITGSRKSVYRWETITVHHSGTPRGSARQFDKDHRRRGMGGLFYHFVIGNGSYSHDGQIEVGWRWRRQAKANRPHDIQVCVVGNFNHQTISEAQFTSLVSLVAVLQQDYNIPITSIRRHEDIRGKHTECPGRNFPFSRLLAALAGNGRGNLVLHR